MVYIRSPELFIFWKFVLVDQHRPISFTASHSSAPSNLRYSDTMSSTFRFYVSLISCNICAFCPISLLFVSSLAVLLSNACHFSSLTFGLYKAETNTLFRSFRYPPRQVRTDFYINLGIRSVLLSLELETKVLHWEHGLLPLQFYCRPYEGGMV